MQRIPLIRCQERGDSAAACLIMISRSQARRPRLAEALAAIQSDGGAEIPHSILTIAAAYGLTCSTMNIDATSLEALPPGTVLSWFGGWFVLYLGARRRSIRILDPAFGYRRVPLDECAHLIQGRAWHFAQSRRTRHARTVPVLARLLAMLLCGTAALAMSLSGSPWSQRPVVPPAPGSVAGPAPVQQSAVRQVLSPAIPSFLGVIVPDKTIDVSALSDGRVLSIEVHLGDRVNKGEILATLDGRIQESDLTIARAAQGSAEAGVSRATHELEQAMAHQDRVDSLERVATFAAEQAGAVYGVAIAGTNLATARAVAAERRAQVEKDQVSVDEARLRAPFDGFVSSRYAAPGATVARGTPIVRLVSSTRLCRFAVPAAYADRVAVGQHVRIEVGEGGPGDRTSGVIERISPELDAASRMLLVEASLDAGTDQGTLPAGRTARVAVALQGEN